MKRILILLASLFIVGCGNASRVLSRELMNSGEALFGKDCFQSLIFLTAACGFGIYLVYAHYSDWKREKKPTFKVSWLPFLIFLFFFLWVDSDCKYFT